MKDCYIFFFVNLCDTINLLGDGLQGTCVVFGFIARFSLSAYCLRRRTLTQRLVDVEWRPRLSRRTFPQICREPFETILTALLGARDLLATATDAYILCSVKFYNVVILSGAVIQKIPIGIHLV